MALRMGQVAYLTSLASPAQSPASSTPRRQEWHRIMGLRFFGSKQTTYAVVPVSVALQQAVPHRIPLLQRFGMEVIHVFFLFQQDVWGD